jgi:uridylate kinase
MKYKKILLKLSGEALSDNHSAIISKTKLDHFVDEIKSINDLGVKIVIVVGGGNIMRGSNTGDLALTRYKADNLGMLATIMNAIVLEDALIKKELDAVVLSSIEMNKICNFYTSQYANELLDNNKIVICSGGIANPYFSTDTGTIIRALETGCDAVFKGTQVDGIYNDDPKKNKDAKRYSCISYDEVIFQDLKVMDSSAILLAKKEKLPIIIFDVHKKDSLKNVFLNQDKQSIIN